MMNYEFKQKSYWLSSREYQSNPPLQESSQFDVVIVGGGFTGLSTAYHLKEANPALSVALVEKEVIGFGASGRNAGFAMTLFGLTMSVTALRFGKKRAKEAHHYMEKAVDLLQELVTRHHIDCDYEHPGFLRVATSPTYRRRILKEIELAHSLGLEGIVWLDKDQLREHVRSPYYLGAWYERRCGLINPAKLAWGWKEIIEKQGVKVYENSPVVSLEKNGPRIKLNLPHATLTADKVVLAVNAYAHLLPALKAKQMPVWTHIVLTEPLQDKHFQEIGWHNRQGIEDARNLVHYYRLTRDNRLLMGGRDVSLSWGNDMDHDLNENVLHCLEEDVRKIFPVLKDIRFTHRWGGPVSVPLDMAPAIGYLGDKNIVYSLGCVGHAVSMNHLNGKTIAELVLEKQTPLTEVFFVNRTLIPCPPGPLRLLLATAIKSALQCQDYFTD